MDFIIRAVDVGFGNTKYISSVVGGEIRCANFPSIAYPCMRDPASQPGFERRKTVSIPINGLFYEVGPDVALAADAFRATQTHDRYIETPEAFPKHRILEIKDPLHANVRGFQIAGMNHALKLFGHSEGTLPVPDREASATQSGERS